jgi:Serine/Threonine/Tyrosine Kinase found in polyvalent proteins
MNHELRNIISGINKVTKGNLIQTALIFVRESERTSREIEKSQFFNKEDEIKALELFANQNNLWQEALDESKYIGEGAEQKVYFNQDGKSVSKINDAIFYLSWQDYFISLIIHNFLFPSTAYQLLGFYRKENVFYSVVQQPFIESTDPTDLISLRRFLENNGFKHKKNNDYYNLELGIILEDLHDENVLTNHGIFFFIDSAIYLLDESIQ